MHDNMLRRQLIRRTEDDGAQVAADVRYVASLYVAEHNDHSVVVWIASELRYEAVDPSTMEEHGVIELLADHPAVTEVGVVGIHRRGRPMCVRLPSFGGDPGAEELAALQCPIETI